MKKNLNIVLQEEMYNKFQICALAQNKAMTALLREMIIEYLDENESMWKPYYDALGIEE